MSACCANINISVLVGMYYIEYTLKNIGESRRHLFSVLGIANNGFYNRLYTLTGQVSLAQTLCKLYIEKLHLECYLLNNAKQMYHN